MCKDLVMSVDVLNEQCPSMISCLLFVRFGRFCEIPLGFMG